jgi:L-fuconolactonase
MARTIDAHHHFWDTNAGRYDYYWMTGDLDVIRGRYGPNEMRPLLEAAGVDHTIIVQTIPSVPETEEFLATAAATDFVAGVVGWVDLTDPAVGETIARLRARPEGRGLVGIRHQVHDEEDPEWLVRPDVRRGVAAVVEAGLTYDILVRARELPSALAIVREFPQARFVVDHIAKPNIKAHEIEPWASRMKPLADFPNVWVKVSGMIEEDDWTAWRPDDLVPYIGRLLDWFGPKRLMFGSNWPVCLIAGSYQQVHDAAAHALGGISADERAAIFGDNAAEAYLLPGMEG